MTKVEEVARAIYAERSGSQGEVDREFIMTNYAPLARAAIEAMRDPTPGMERAWRDINPVQFDHGTFHAGHAAAISAALSDR
jgi:hypothetical protein